MLADAVEHVTCRWCGRVDSVELVRDRRRCRHRRRPAVPGRRDDRTARDGGRRDCGCARPGGDRPGRYGGRARLVRPAGARRQAVGSWAHHRRRGGPTPCRSRRTTPSRRPAGPASRPRSTPARAAAPADTRAGRAGVGRGRRVRRTATPGGTDDGPAEKHEAAAGEPVLPKPVRQRVITLAPAVLGRLPADEVPAPLRAAARFTPAKRARLAGTVLAAALASDPVFRLRAAEQVEQESPRPPRPSRAPAPGRPRTPVELRRVPAPARPAGPTCWPAPGPRSTRRPRASRPGPRRGSGAPAGGRSPPAGRRATARAPRSGSGPPPTPPVPRRRPSATSREQTGPAPGPPSGPAPPPRRRWPRNVAGRRRRTPACRPRSAGSGSGWPRPRTRSRPAGARPGTPGRPTRRGCVGCCSTPRPAPSKGCAVSWRSPQRGAAGRRGGRRDPRPDGLPSRGDDPELLDRLLGLPRVHLGGGRLQRDQDRVRRVPAGRAAVRAHHRSGGAGRPDRRGDHLRLRRRGPAAGDAARRAGCASSSARRGRSRTT